MLERRNNNGDSITTYRIDLELIGARHDAVVEGLDTAEGHIRYYLPLGGPTCRITALAVAPGQQRLGIGRKLLREAEQRARQAGAARIELTTGSQRAEAHAFYRACGYSESALRFLKPLGA